MVQWAGPVLDTLWHNGLSAIPLVLVAGAAARFLPCRPATRHLIWVTVLAWLVAAPLLPHPPAGEFASAHDSGSGVTDVANQLAPIEETRARPLRKLDSPGANREAARLAVNNSSSKNSEDIRMEPVGPVSHPSKSFSPPPRFAARAEHLPPDKLARAKDAAGPRSHARRVDDPAAATMSKVKTSTLDRSTSRPALPQSKDGHAASRRSFPGSPTSEPYTGEVVIGPTGESFHSLGGRAGVAQVTKSPVGVVTAASEPVAQAPQKIGEASVPDQAAGTVNPAATTIPSASWRPWMNGLVGIRDAVTSLPPIPGAIWLGGTGLLLIMAGVRVLSFRQRLRRARPAPREVVRVVEDACMTLGVRRAPQTLMVDGRISPMVWCGVSPKLILPTLLWHQLDDLGRKAVVYHELAHIRRMDHRTAWIESGIGMLYWWHPLVWWVRSRLHAEAENCCDAWVMTLLPRTRRAYATALLKTREYLSGQGELVPAMGIGITPGRARLFARRLTMVMTESVRPRLSATGISLVLLVAACGWVASPARSCPEEEAAAAAAAAAREAKAPCFTAKGKGQTPCNAPCNSSAPKAEAGSLTSFEKHMAEREKAGVLVAQPVPPAAVSGVVVATPAAGSAAQDEKAAKRARRIAELQAEMARLERKIETITDQLEAQGEGSADDDNEPGMLTPRPPRPPRPPRAPRAGQGHGFFGHPTPPAPPGTPMPPMPPMPPPPGPHGRGPGAALMVTPRPGQGWADVSNEQTSWKTYKLSKGKAEDFFKFMSRSDVPIYVRSNSEGIDIQATHRQHEIFDAFFRIVDPSEERGPGQGLLEAPWPMLAFAHGGCPGGCCKGGAACGHCMKAAELRAMAEEVRAKARADAVELRARARGEAERVRAQARDEAERARARLRRHARDARSEARDQQEMMEGLERQSQVLAEVAASYEEQAQRIRERAEAVAQRVDSDEEAAASADAYRLHVESLERSAEEMARQAQQLQMEVQTIEQRAREVEENARQMEHHAEELDERADAVREAVETLEHGLEPTPQLVESVLALVSDIEQIIPAETVEAIEAAVSAVSFPVIELGEIPIEIEGLDDLAEELDEAIDLEEPAPDEKDDDEN